jgi:hypothetical protein
MTTAAPTSTATVAEELVSLCRAGRFLDAVNTLYSDDIVSVESMGNEQMPVEMRGITAVREKGEWWAENNLVHSSEIEGPLSGTISLPSTITLTSRPSRREGGSRWKRWLSTR